MILLHGRVFITRSRSTIESTPVLHAITTNSLFNLIKDIASKFYPKSKNPVCELSINQLIMLDEYIIK